jgi:hypothetical protein
MAKAAEGFTMRSMTSRQIHQAIRAALGEVSRALASGEMDRSGRYYSDSELRERFANLGDQPKMGPAQKRKSTLGTAESA